MDSVIIVIYRLISHSTDGLIKKKKNGPSTRRREISIQTPIFNGIQTRILQKHEGFLCSACESFPYPKSWYQASFVEETLSITAMSLHVNRRNRLRKATRPWILILTRHTSNMNGVLNLDERCDGRFTLFPAQRLMNYPWKCARNLSTTVVRAILAYHVLVTIFINDAFDGRFIWFTQK